MLAVGAYGKDGTGCSMNSAGHVRVYKYFNKTWTKLGDDIDGESADDQSGYSMSLSSDGTVLAVGAPNNDGNGSLSGHVQVYKWLTNTWTKLGDDIIGEAAGDASGQSVSLSSDGTVSCGSTVQWWEWCS